MRFFVLISESQVENSNEALDEIENGPIYGMDSALAGSVMSLHSSKKMFCQTCLLTTNLQ